MAHEFKRVPTASPPFTVGSLRKAIPAHCWERSLLTSSKYLACDLAMAAGLYYFSTLIPSAPAGPLAAGRFFPHMPATASMPV